MVDPAEELVNKLMNRTFYVNIRGKKVVFDVRDEIFHKTKPVTERDRQQTHCSCCQRDLRDLLANEKKEAKLFWYVTIEYNKSY